MGELIIRKVRDMNWKAKISLILVFAMILSTFMYQGWYKPKFIEAAPTADGRIVYSISTTAPQSRAYTGSSNTFAAGAAMQTGVAQTFMVDRAAPTRNEHIAGYVTATGVLYMQRWNGTAWSAEWNVTVGGNGVDGRRFDIAYEQTTGNAMVVYSNNTTGANELRYNRWNGSTWSGATNMDSARLTGTPTSIKLTSQKVSGSNKIAATILDSGNILTTLIWSGSTWGNEPAASHGTLAGTAGQNDLFDHAYESLSGDLFVVFTTSTPQQNYRTFTDSSSTWGAITSYATSRAAPLQMLATPDPQSDKILVMFNRSASVNVYARIWNGSADGNASTFVTTGVTLAINKKTIAGKWLVLDGTSYAVAMTATTTAGTIGYGYFNGTAWTTAQTYATGVATTAQWMDCDSDPLGLDTMMLTYSDGSNDLYARRLVLTSGPTFTFTDPVGGALTAALGSIISQNFSFAYNQTKPPTLTTPTATSIADVTAILGANVTSDNGSTITERGTVWNTTGTPTTADNKTTTTGTTGVFTTNVSSITAGTKIYYRGYAINGIGTGYSPQGSFYTEPATQASGVSFTNVGGAGMTVNWTRGSGDGVIVLMKSGSAVTGTPSDGTYATYNANTAFGSGTLIGDGYVVYKGTGTSVDVTALSGSTAYYVAVYEYSGAVNDSGNDLGTNYKPTPATGNQTTAASQTITVGDATSPSNKNVYRNDTNKAVSAFTLQLTAGSGTATVSQLVVTGTASAGSSQTETSSVKIYQDNNADREWDAGDTLVATTTFSTNTATFSGLSIPVTTTLANYIIVYDINAAATATRTLTASVTGVSHNANILTNNDNADATLTITSQTLTYGNGAAQPSNKTVYRGETHKALDTFTLSVNGGTATVSQIVVTGTDSGFNSSQEASAVEIYQDNGSTANEWDSGDTLIASTTFATNTATFSGLSIPVTTSSVSYIVTIDVSTTATAARTITAQLSGLTSTANTNTDSDTAGATLTIGAVQTTTAGNGTTQPSAKTVYRGETNKALDTFTLSVNVGTTTVTQIVVTSTTSAGSGQTESSAVEIYQDNGSTANEWDSGDTLISSTTFATNTATFSGLSIPVTTSSVSYIITIDVNPTATAARTITAQISALSSYAQTDTDSDTGGATLTIGATQTTTAGNGTTQPSAKTVYRGEPNKALDTFTLSVNAGTTTVTQIVVTGTATGGGDSSTEASAVKIYQDNGSTANEWDSGDTLISSTTFATNTATFSGLSIPVTTSSVSYIITIDVNPTATAARTITAQISALTSYAQTNTDSDTGGATLTIGSNTLTVAEGTNPTSRIVMQGSTKEAVGAFSLQTSAGSTLVSQIVITGTNPSNVQSGGVRLWEDNGTVGSWDVADVQVGSGVTFSGTTATFAGLTVQPTTSLKNYIVTYNIAEKSTVGQTVTGYISGITATANTTTNNDNNADATLTIKGSSVTVSCGSCHAYPPTDGSRSGATGAVVGDHQPHNYVVCSTCHVVPATETSADFGHRNGNIQMKANISGGTYSRGTSFAQTNNPTTGTCSNISCHGGNNPTPQWGVGTATCVDCHNGTITRTMAAGTLDNVVAEFGLAWGHKSSGRGAVTASDCIVCHLEGNYSTQRTSATYHANGNIDLRDPDGAGETAITNISGGAFTFTKFSTSYAAGSRTTTGHTSNNIDNVLTQKFCLACHDSDGATNATARTAGGTAAMPFGGVALGANYTAANGAIGTQGLINVNSQFATSNSSRHPVLGPRNSDYATAARLNDPYKPTGTRGTSGTLSNSVVINCFDCHNAPTVLTARTVAAHGNAVTLRGQPVAHNAGTPITTTPAAANEPSLCKVCHAGYDTQATGYHGTGSAWYSDDRTEHIEFTRWGCNKCHASNYDTVVVRPVRALDNHGVNVLPSGGLAKTGRWSTQGTPIAFIRNTVQLSNHQPRVAGGTTFSASCTGMAGNLCSDSRTETYTIGGTY